MSDKFLRQFATDISRHSSSPLIARDYPVKVLGLRGYDRHLGAPGNDFGVYDDLIVACAGNRSFPFKASTDPGILMIQNPINSAGCAILSEATHFYQKGGHQNNTYKAFVQAEPMKVYRLDPDGRRVGSSWSPSSINIHSGAGGDDKGDDVQNISAGCQVIFNPPGYFKGAPDAPWFRFHKLISEAMTAHGQTVFPYRLMDASKMV